MQTLDPMVPSQLVPEIMAIEGLNPYAMHDSHPRQTMFGGHITQNLVISNPTLRRDFTGVERKYGQYTHMIRMPVDGVVKKIIRKYQSDMSFNPHNIQPISTIVYENTRTRELGVLHIKYHNCMHQYFGFRFVLTQKALQLRVGDVIAKGTILAHSPTINPETFDYKYGIEAQVACMTIPNVIEDGCVARRGFLESLKTTAYETRTFQWGKTHVPLNLYGDDEKYKPFPDIGEFVREDGLLFASREFHPILAIVQMSKEALKEYDIDDSLCYGRPGARVINIEVIRGRPNNTVTLTGMNEQAEFYYRKSQKYHQELRDIYRDECRARNNTPVPLEPEYERILVDSEALLDRPSGTRTASNLPIPMMNDIPLDEWFVKITFEYTLTPTVGYKLTGTAGDKVVIVDVWDDDKMPREILPDGSYGQVVDIIQDPDGTNRRMNFSRLFQQYFNASQVATTRRMREILKPRTQAAYLEAYQYLLGWFDIVVPRYAAIIREEYDSKPHMFVESVDMEDGFRYWLPTDHNRVYVDVVRELKEKYPAHIGPVEYFGMSQQKVRTEVPVLVGGIYLMLLEKIGNTQTAVSSGKVQHYGVLAKVSALDKYTMPGRQSPGRIIGETEARLIAAFCGGNVVSELFDQTNNIAAHRFICESILRADTPTNIPAAIDRTLVPWNGGRALCLVKHFLECQGSRFVRGDEADAVTGQPVKCYSVSWNSTMQSQLTDYFATQALA